MAVSIPYSGICYLAHINGSRFITSDNVTQKGVIFLKIPVQKAVTDVQTVISVLFHELFGNTPCSNFTEAKSVKREFIGTTVTNLYLVCHFTGSHPPVLENQHAHLFNVPFSSCYGWVP